MIEKSSFLRTGIGVAIGASAGAGLMFLFDPARGAARRSMIRDKAAGSVRGAEKLIQHKGENLANHIAGLVAQARGAFTCEDAPDGKLEARVRTKLGRLVSKPRTVDVSVHEGVVTLRGWVQREEIPELVKGVEHVAGVHRVESQLAS